MATVNKFVNGRRLEDVLVDMSGGALADYAFEIKAYADVALIEARDFSLSIGREVDFDAFIEVRPWNGGYDVVLDDTFGDGAAYNIEKGRNVEFFDDVTGLPMGDMAGLFLLERAVEVTADHHRGEIRRLR